MKNILRLQNPVENSIKYPISVLQRQWEERGNEGRDSIPGVEMQEEQW